MASRMELTLFGFRNFDKDILMLLPSSFHHANIKEDVLDFCGRGKSSIKDLLKQICVVYYTDPVSFNDLKKMEYNGWSVDENDTFTCIGDVLYRAERINGQFITSLKDKFSFPYPYIIQDADMIQRGDLISSVYLVNLDENVLEIWKGKQMEPDFKNRYGIEKKGFGRFPYPCKLTEFCPLWM